MVSKVLAYKPFSLAQAADFHSPAAKDNSAKAVLPIFLDTAGSITKGPMPMVNSDNLTLASWVANT
jgi:hypothetical protein